MTSDVVLDFCHQSNLTIDNFVIHRKETSSSGMKSIFSTCPHQLLCHPELKASLKILAIYTSYSA